MIDSLFALLGSLFASGFGVLVLAALAGLIVVLWEWRLALIGAAVLQVAAAGLLVYVHGVGGVIAAGQALAAVLCAAILALATLMHPDEIAGRQAGNWPLRLMALAFALGGWWFLDPGFTLPQFSQLETDLLLWLALCSLVLLGFSSSPLFGGAAVLIWSVPLFAFAAVLLPGSGLAVMVGITQLLVVLACGYLILVEPASATGARRLLPWGRGWGAVAGRSGAQSGTVLPGGMTAEQTPRPVLRRPFGRKPAARTAAAPAGSPPVNAAGSGPVAPGPVVPVPVGSTQSSPAQSGPQRAEEKPA